MKLITSEMDAETEKWEEPDNDIVKRAKNMSSMAFSMYLFTRGEGPLKTTQDLFVQAEYFAEEGKKLYKTVREFAEKVRPKIWSCTVSIILGQNKKKMCDCGSMLRKLGWVGDRNSLYIIL